MMRKFLVCGLLLGAVALFGSMGPTPARAQKKEAKAGKIEVGTGKDGKFRFTVRNASDKLLAMSGPNGYASEKEVMKAIDELKEVLKSAKVYLKKKAGN